MYSRAVPSLSAGEFVCGQTSPLLEGTRSTCFDHLPVKDLRSCEVCQWQSELMKRGCYEQVTLENGEEYVVVGSLDLNQGIALPGEVAVKKIPQISTSFRLARTSSSITIAAPSRSTQVTISALLYLLLSYIHRTFRASLYEISTAISIL